MFQLSMYPRWKFCATVVVPPEMGSDAKPEL